MENNEKYDRVKKTISKIKRVSSICGATAFIFLFASPFVWIWHDGWIALKLFISGVIILLITSYVDNALKLTLEKVKNGFDKIKEESDKPKQSKFQQRLKEMQEKQKNAKKMS